MTTSLTGLGTRKRRRRGTPVIFFISFTMVVFAAALLILDLVQFSQAETQLPAGITVAGVNVGGLDRRTAVAQWSEAYAEPITLFYQNQYGNHPIVLNPDVLNFRLSNETMIAQAIASSEQGGGFWRRFANKMLGIENTQTQNIAVVADYQTNRLREFLLDIKQRYDQTPGAGGADLQTLTIYEGSGGFELDVDAAMIAVEQALFDPENRIVQLPVVGSDAVENRSLSDLRQLIIDYLDSQDFDYASESSVASVFIMDLTTGEELHILSDVAVTAASTAKVPIMIDYFRQLSFSPTPEEAWLMANSLLCSNNSSSNLIMQIIGGDDLFAGIEDVVDNTQYLGAKNTFLTAPFDLGIEGQELGSIPPPETSPNADYNTSPDPFNQTTTEDLGGLFALLYDCAEFGSGLASAYPDGQINQNECRQMLELMSGNDLLRLLQAGVPEGTRISHKNGWVADTVGEAGVVYSPSGRDYVISVFLWEDVKFQDFNKLWTMVEEISRAAWNHFNPNDQLLTRRDNIPETAQLCEGNYLPPSPQAVDLNDIDGWKQIGGQ